MNSSSAIALSGMNTAQVQLAAAAHNIAHQATPGFKRQTVQAAVVAGGGARATVASAPQAGPAPEADVVGLLQARHGFMANLAVFKTQDRMLGALLNARG
jgi:flagellar hook protein FlgE